MESLLTQTLIVHIIRTRRIPFFGSRASLHMTLTTLVIMAIGAGCPIRRSRARSEWFRCRRSTGPGLAPSSLTYAALTHFVKTWFFNRYGGD